MGCAEEHNTCYAAPEVDESLTFIRAHHGLLENNPAEAVAYEDDRPRLLFQARPGGQKALEELIGKDKDIGDGLAELDGRVVGKREDTGVFEGYALLQPVDARLLICPSRLVVAVESVDGHDVNDLRGFVVPSNDSVHAIFGSLVLCILSSLGLRPDPGDAHGCRRPAGVSDGP